MTSDWITASALSDLIDSRSRHQLEGVHPMKLPGGSILFQPGDAVRGFAIVLSGRIGVYLTGTGGRGILLYQIEPGQTCVQSTLGILGDEDYSAEAVCETDCELALIPRDRFETLLDAAPKFRRFVFSAFAARMQTMMHLLEQVAFVKIETRLAAALLSRLDSNNKAVTTHQELATQIGTAREVVSRRLDRLAKDGVLHLDRGVITIDDRTALQEYAEKT